MAEHKNINFTDRNAVERFLEGDQFRPCGNLKCLPVNLQYQIVYLPACLENRFHREGIAEHLEMPLLSRHLSPMTYQSVGIWAPLVSCPRDCKGYRNRTVAKLQNAGSAAVNSLFGKPNRTGEVEKPWWKEWSTLIVTGVIVGIIVLLLTPYFAKTTTPTGEPVQKQPVQSQPEHKPTQPSTDDAKPIAPAKPPSRSVGLVTNPKQVPTPKAQDCSDNKGICIGGDNNGSATVIQSTPEVMLQWEHFEDPNQAQGAKHPFKVVRAWVNHAWENARFAVMCDRPCTSLHFGMGGMQEAGTGRFPDAPNVAIFVVCAPNPFPPTTKAENECGISRRPARECRERRESCF
jgi:hypothetical protein